jgi:outer membrane protein
MLFVAKFSGADKSADSQQVTDDVQKSKIAYVNVDSVLAYYDLYNALSLQLAQKQQDLQNQLQSKMLSLQNRAYQLQQQYSQHLITTQKYQEKAEKLQNEQMQLQQWQDQKALELNDEQMNMMNRIYDSLKAVVDVINADKKYDLIITNSTDGSGVLLYGNPDWNITNEVIELLNQRAGVIDSLNTNAQ